VLQITDPPRLRRPTHVLRVFSSPITWRGRGCTSNLLFTPEKDLSPDFSKSFLEALIYDLGVLAVPLPYVTHPSEASAGAEVSPIHHGNSAPPLTAALLPMSPSSIQSVSRPPFFELREISFRS